MRKDTLKNDNRKNKICLGALNCQGVREKIDQTNFSKLAESLDIFGVSETWLKGKENNDISLPDFHFYSVNRETNKGPARGGVGVFIRCYLKKFVKVRWDISTENFLWCKVSKEYLGYNEDLYVCFVYIPPEYSTRERKLNKDHFVTLFETTSKIKSDNVLLMGDFNARTLTLSDTLLKEKDDDLPTEFFSRIYSKRCNQDLVGNNYGKKLAEYCIASKSYIVNGRTIGDLQGKLTCFEQNGASTVDYAIASDSMHKYISKFQILEPSCSDHCPIMMELNTQKQCNAKSTGITAISPPIRWNEKTKMLLSLKMQTSQTKTLSNEINELLDSSGNIDTIVEKLNEVYNIQNSAQRRPRKKNKKSKPKKWYDKSCYELASKLKNTAKLLTDSPNNPHLRGSLCKTRKEYRKLIKFKRQEWKKQMVTQLEKIEANNPKEYWNLVNELREKKCDSTSFDTESFTCFFEKLYSLSKKDRDVQDYVDKHLNNIPKEITIPNFVMDELIKAIRLLKNNKAAGPDKIIAEMLKATPTDLLSLILKIMNTIKTTCHYPSSWALGITSLLYKEGDDEDPNNYRAITVTAALSKVFAIMLNERLENWSISNNVMRIEQIGFQKKSRTSDHLFVLKTVIDFYKSQGQTVYVCFVDFQKAFDCVWRNALLYKLLKQGMNPLLVKLIQSMYCNTSQTLKINSGITRAFRTYRGVRQGCILSPRLFNLFINDIPGIFDQSCKPIHMSHSLKLSCLMYADDLVILSESPSGLQSCLDKLETYTEKWGLKLNLKKTKIMIFRNRSNKIKPQFFFGGNQVEITDQYKYLGTIVTNNGSFKANETNLKKKGLRASFIISKNIGPHSKPSTAIKIFEKVVEPILLHNAEITGAFIPNTWTYDKFLTNMWDVGKEANKVIIGFLRQLLGVHKKTTNIAVLAETGKYPIALNIFIRIIKYWIRVNNSENRLLSGAVNANRELLKKNKQNWERIIIFLLKSIDVNINKTTEKIEVPNLKQKLQNLFKNWWNSQAKPTGVNKLDFYHQYEKSFQFEKYLDNVPRYIRTHITRLRLSSHSLPVEILRYNKNKKNRESRICHICNTNTVGDEDHYLLKCNNGEISRIRSDFMTKIRKEVPQLELFTERNIIEYCMVLHDPMIQMPVAIFVKNLLCMYKEETEGTPLSEKPTITTRIGRVCRKPDKLNL